MNWLIYYVLIPYCVAFIAANSLKSLLSHGNRDRYIYTSKPGKSNKKAPMGVMDKVLIIEIIAIVLYVIADFWVYCRMGSEPSTLTISFFAVCGGENGWMAWIKTRKEQERFRMWQKQDEGKPEEYKKDDSL